MGTRSLTIIKDNWGNKEILVMYRQYDGYFEGHGKELAEYLAPCKLVNGLPCRQDCTILSNGMSELAAQLICYFKSKYPSGNIYVYPAGARDCGEEYTYIVSVENGQIILEAREEAREVDDHPIIFQGTPQDYLKVFLPDYLKKQEENKL